MAVYTVENGQLKRVAEEMAEYTGQNWDNYGSVDELLKDLGFFKQDDVELAYARYQRVDGDCAALPGVVQIFDVSSHDFFVDFILVDDHLPNYLAVMAMLSPLVVHAQAVMADVQRELGNADH